MTTTHLLTWQQQLANGYSNSEQLCQYLQLSPQQLAISHSTNFALRVPQSFVDCMEKGNPNDPLLRQVLPINDELNVYQGFNNDPVGDLAAMPLSGVLHKYQGRVLLMTTGSCAINCRYCFRRNFPYNQHQLSKHKQQLALKLIANDDSIHEVILSGGDPLLLSDSRLLAIIEQLNTIPHLKRLRIHSRLPIVLPARINPEFIKTLKQSKHQLIIVIHCNHPNELSNEVTQACTLLKQAGIQLLNQTVLLKGVNDNANSLIKLSEQLFANGVLPYYLHLLDKAQGTGHFEVDEITAIHLTQQLQQQLSGYLVPKLVREIAGEQSKTLIHF